MTWYCIILYTDCTSLYWRLLYCTWGVLYCIRFYPLHRTLRHSSWLYRIKLYYAVLSENNHVNNRTSLCSRPTLDMDVAKTQTLFVGYLSGIRTSHHVILDNDNLLRRRPLPWALAQIKQIPDVLELITDPPQSHWVLMARDVFGLASPKSLNSETWTNRLLNICRWHILLLIFRYF